MNEEAIKQAATYYVEYRWSMKQVAENMCVGETTVRRWLNVYLRKIDFELFTTVQKHKAHTLYYNMHRREENGRFKKW